MIDFRDNEKAKINQVYKPSDKVAQDRKLVYKRYSYMKFGRMQDGQNIEQLWDKWEKQYEAWRPNKSADDWQSNIVPPFTTTIVEKALSEIVDQTVQPSIIARGPEDVPRAKLLNYVKDYTWEIGNGDLQLYSAVKQALILGKTIWQEDYYQDKRQVRLLTKFDPKTNEETYEIKEIYDFDDVYGETINIRSFFIDPAARTINSGRYKANDCIRRYIMNFDTFRETFIDSRYDQFGHAKLVKPGGDTDYYQFYQPPNGIDKDNDVEVLFYWGRRPDKLIIVANDVVVRDGPNPYNHKQLPFAEGSDVPRLDKFYARGEPALLESLQDEMTTLRRMRIDRQHIDIWKMFLVSNRETLDEDEAIVAPSRFLYVDDPRNSIVPLEYRDINPSAYKEEELLRQDGREVTGVESPQPASTATQAAINKESTQRSLRLKIWLLSRELVTGITRLRVPNIVQYYSTPKVSNIVGSEKMMEYRKIRTNDVELKTSKTGELVEDEKKGQYFFTVSPDMIIPQYGGYDYKLSGEPTFPISKPLQQQKVNEFMQHPVIQAALQMGHYDVGRMADVLSDVNEFDPEKFKLKEEGVEDQVIDEEQLYELANRENEIILSGKRIPGTPGATRKHTEIHLAFIDSDEFRQAVAQNEEIMANMIYHVTLEEKAQEARKQVSAQLGKPTTTPAQGIESGEASAAQPNKLQGPEMTPAGQGGL